MTKLHNIAYSQNVFYLPILLDTNNGTEIDYLYPEYRSFVHSTRINKLLHSNIPVIFNIPFNPFPLP